MNIQLDEAKKIASAMKRLEKMSLSKAFDPFRPDSRPNFKQQEILNDIGKIQYRWVVAGNQSGKSQLAAREIAWIVTDTHPTWKKPEAWGDEPMLILVAGQNRQNMEIEIWEKKIRPFLDQADWRIVRQGGALQHVENRRNNAKIVFLSHADASDKTRTHLQGYVAHYVWLDEMPGSMAILEELQRRVDAREGYFIATFTPKFRNDEIRRIVDAARPPVGKKYRMSKLDNPIYASRLDAELQKLDGFSESYKKTILFGDWSTGDSAVYAFEYEKMVVQSLPDTYSRGWRHVASLDPAARSKFGYTLWAEEPSTGIWFLVNDRYIEGIADPNGLFAEVQARNNGYYIYRQVCDPHEGWYIGLANTHGVNYHVPYNKNDRKTDLIKGLQQALTSGKIKIGQWCTNFIDEIQSCQWSETSDRIVNASSYHELDCAQYFVDCIPRPDPGQIVQPWYVELRKGNEERKKANSAQERMRVGNYPGARSLRQWGDRRFNVR